MLEQQRFSLRVAAAWLLVCSGAIIAPAEAMAASTLGEVVKHAATDVMAPVGFLLSGLSYLVGLFLIARGLSCLKDSSNGGSLRTADGLFRIAGGSILVSLPDMFGIGLLTYFGSTRNATDNVSIASQTAGAVSDCLATAASGGAVTCVAKNVAVNLVPVFVNVSLVAMFVIGGWMVFHGLKTAAESFNSSNPQMLQLPRGWTAKFLVGVLFLNMPHLFSLIQNTFGIGAGVLSDSGMMALAGQPPSILAYKAPSTVAILQQYQELIGWCLTILVMFGVLYVWKGVSQLVSYAEGGQGSMQAGFIHIIGGVLLSNGKWSTCILLSTVIGNGAGFCS